MWGIEHSTLTRMTTNSKTIIKKLQHMTEFFEGYKKEKADYLLLPGFM
jgi:hypothetical protein